MGMKIARVEVIPYALPFREPYVTARGRIERRLLYAGGGQHHRLSGQEQRFGQASCQNGAARQSPRENQR